MMDEILDLARKVAEQAEVFAIEREETPVAFEANKLKLLEARTSYGVALRIVKNGRVGFTGTSRFDDPQSVVNAAVEASQFGPEAKFVLPRLSSYPDVETYTDSIETVTIEQLIDLGKEMIARIRDHTPEVVCEGGLSKETTRITLRNSNGGQADYKSSTFGIGVEGVVVNGEDMLFVWDSESSCEPILDVSDVVRKVNQRFDRAAKIVPAPQGNLPVIFTPSGVASALIASLSSAFNGKVALQGASPLLGKLGQELFDTKFSMYDDPLVKLRPGSRPCDDEGVPSQRNVLVEKGVPIGFLYDLQTAALAGTKSTGSASRSLDSLPSPSRSNLLVATGRTPIEEMIANVDKGLLVETLMGATQGNILGGDFSGNVLLGYKIEKGEIVGRVKNTMVSGNVYAALKGIDAIGSEAEWVGGSLSTPAILIQRLAIATKA